MNKRKKEEYGIFPPYIDAYIKSYGNPINFADFSEKMKCHAQSWGEQSIGSTVLRCLESQQEPEILKDTKDRVIVCIGWFGEKSYACVVDHDNQAEKYWFKKLEVIEFNWPGEWDVT